MAHFDLGQTLSAGINLYDSAHAASANGVAVDTQGFEGVAVISTVGDDTTVDLTTDSMTLAFYESDDDTFGNATEVPASRVVDNPAINAPQSSFIASVVPSKRYLFVQVPAPASGSVEIAVSTILGYATDVPT